ncbi:Lipoprotein releasing system ATP-binding protein [Parvularcula bermudensis HTCC2503]|uniref:Lipoprotein releasing system ATP-binding protein n=1 Tax=Parvularcula bermudensis (strain ATCC BAA-594 / HTCC2503 / KCTC 12087) TaxID=314260 RepID=E0TG54_PARBH|nr:ABC transporter ATP-binding protein [Parvularcula bermudensis]ADM10625.1 Lipoprotein releasing system ATP-binding protein [Parvularcula bermudensis HTCC2503]
MNEVRSSAPNEAPVLRLEGIKRAYGDLIILEEATLSIAAGEIVGLLGPSGSGKSSLLHIAGLLEAPTAGTVLIEGGEVSRLSSRERTAVRREKIGFVYQFHHLLPEFTARQNVAFPLRIAGVSPKAAEARATDLLSQMGLDHRLDHQPAQLSGGEKQRAAIARALANQPRLLLADEPTGNLDVDTSGRVFAALLTLVRQEGLAAMIATHDRSLAAQMDRVIHIDDHRLVETTVPDGAALI